MRTRAAVLCGAHQQWQVKDVDLDDPRWGEVLVKTYAAGLCHSDEHMVTGDLGSADAPGVSSLLPVIGGHEGSGVVIEVGPEVTDLEVGDHVAVSFVPAASPPVPALRSAVPRFRRAPSMRSTRDLWP